MKVQKLLFGALLAPIGVADCEFATAAASASAASAAWKSLDYRFFVAGGTCAAISHGITTPIDVVKTKIQANPRKYNKGMAAAALDIIKMDGPGALLQGLGPTVVGYGVEGAIKVKILDKERHLTVFGKKSSL